MDTSPDISEVEQTGGDTGVLLSSSAPSISHPLLKTSADSRVSSINREPIRAELSTDFANANVDVFPALISRSPVKFGMDDHLNNRKLQEQSSGRISNISPSTSPAKQSLEADRKRFSFSSLLSLNSYGQPSPNSEGRTSSIAGSLRSNPEPYLPRLEIKSPSLLSMDTAMVTSNPTTATDNTSVLATSHAVQQGAHRMTISTPTIKTHISTDPGSGSLPRLENDRSRSRGPRRPSVSTAASSASPHSSDRSKAPLGKIGVCALDGKARSKPSRNILTRLQNNGEFEVIVFGDKVILDEDVENWPLCDYLISFFSDGFPLDKAIAYAQLRKPFCVNDLPMQKVLWDRRLCLTILDNLGVPTPARVEVNRDGGPVVESDALADHVHRISGVEFRGPNTEVDGNSLTKNVSLSEDGETLIVDGSSIRKPFVEKPVSGEDHNIIIYFPKSAGGGGRRLFRKIGNKSSEWVPDLSVPRSVTEADTSYIYEQFLDVENAEDVKAYTVGTDFCHAETRKSPVVDGLVRRNTHGKEIRYVTSLSTEEATMASKIALGFGQRICGFDLLRAQERSFVIDVNGWSFVKDNNEYYDKCSRILRELFIQEKERRDPNKASIIADPLPDLPVDAINTKPPNTTHRDVLKGIFRSRSLTKLRGPLHSRRKDSQDISAHTTPISSPPTTERVTSPLLDTQTVIPEIKERSPTQIEAQLSKIVSPSADRLPLKTNPPPPPASKHSWKLKGMVAVIRHADRTPKQKFKFTFHTEPFVELLKGHQEEVLLKGEDALASVIEAVDKALQEGIEDKHKLSLLKATLIKKGSWHGTKVQLKPMFRKRKPEEIAEKLKDDGHVINQGRPSPFADIGEDQLHLVRTGRSDSLPGVTLSRYAAAENDLVIDKLQLVMKWGGEPTHSARYQAQDLGENMRNDLLLMNREVLSDVRIFTSSEPRVSTSAQIWAASFLDQKEIPDSFISVRKDLLDDSNAAKDVMDKVKKKLKLLLRAGHEAPKQFAWPPNTPEPSIVVRQVVELMKFHRKVMRHNFMKLNSATSSLSAINRGDSPETDPLQGQAEEVSRIQARWCTGEDAELFKERWEKLFSEFSDSEKVDPSKISELYDTMKYDALHNRPFLEWAFTPSSKYMEEFKHVEALSNQDGSTESHIKKPSLEKIVSESATNEVAQGPSIDKPERKSTMPPPSTTISERARSTDTIAQRIGFRRKSAVTSPPSPVIPPSAADNPDSYFKLYSGNSSGNPNSSSTALSNKAKQDQRLSCLRQLYRLGKILFDFICPQEYGISDAEKLEIGLLTSLPLLQEIVSDLEEVQASESAKSFIYFTKESHVYTLLNAIMGGGIKTKISRPAIPELDYLSQIVFELYEAEDKESDTFAYSIKITITPGCHTADPLDVQLDSKHSIGCAPRRSLTAHQDWKEVIETLRAKFHTVSLPKSFLAVNLSEWHAREMRRSAEGKVSSGSGTGTAAGTGTGTSSGAASPSLRSSSQAPADGVSASAGSPSLAASGALTEGVGDALDADPSSGHAGTSKHAESPPPSPRTVTATAAAVLENEQSMAEQHDAA